MTFCLEGDVICFRVMIYWFFLYIFLIISVWSKISLKYSVIMNYEFKISYGIMIFIIYTK